MERRDLNRLNTLMQIPFEKWNNHGVGLMAVSANAEGLVNSGILSSGEYFYKCWDYKDGRYTNPHYEID